MSRVSRGRLVSPLSVLGPRRLFDEFVRRLFDPSFVVPSAAALNGERSVAEAGPSASVMVAVFCAQGRRLSIDGEVCRLRFYSRGRCSSLIKRVKKLQILHVG